MCLCVFLWVCVCLYPCENKFKCFQSRSIYSVSSVFISLLRNTEASRGKTIKKNRIRLIQMFWQLFIQQFLFHTWERTSKLNIINPTDNGRKTPPLRCYISNQALSVQLDMKPLISPRYIRSWTNMCLALILIFTVDILWVSALQLLPSKDWYT